MVPYGPRRHARALTTGVLAMMARSLLLGPASTTGYGPAARYRYKTSDPHAGRKKARRKIAKASRRRNRAR